MQLSSTFDLGARVPIDNDASIVAVVTMLRFILIRPGIVGEQAEVSWFDHGKLETAWIEPWRLSLAPR